MRLLAALLVSATVALGACGGDSKNDSASTTTGSSTTTTEPGAGATGKTGSTDRADKRKRARAKAKVRRKTAALQKSIEKTIPETPAQTGVTDKAAESDKRNLRKIQRQQEQSNSGSNVTKFPPKQRAVYAKAVILCQLLGPAGLKAKYKVSSTKPAQLARAYANDVASGSGSKAAYQGCLDGLAARG